MASASRAATAAAVPSVVHGDHDDHATADDDNDGLHHGDIELKDDEPAPVAPSSMGDIKIVEPDYSPLPIGQRPWDANPHYMSDDERKLLAAFRMLHSDVCRPYNDKHVMAYLFTMHNDITAAARRLKRYTVSIIIAHCRRSCLMYVVCMTTGYSC